MDKKEFKKSKNTKSPVLRNLLLGFLSLCFIFVTIVVLVYSQMKLPDFNNFLDYKISNSTKIYDRTGDIVLYDLQGSVRRTEIPLANMGENLKKATIAVEDATFYTHGGVRPKSTIYAIFKTLTTGKKQGGSTITQQVVKNAILTRERTVSRKIKEWVLAIRIESTMSKDQILETYLNQNPYGGVTYGAYEGARGLFNKDPKDLTLAESAYMAAIPKGPSIYSPYGKNKQKLEDRKNYVLKRMLDTGAITEDEYKKALAEVVVFAPAENRGIKSPHFVFYIKEYLALKYGDEAVENGGLSVYTTLDYDLQKKAEEILKRKSLEAEKAFDASNQALVTIDPKSGQILAMVGSRDYFDTKIDGAYNVATAQRQPGSSFKPIVYAKAFEKGYTPDTVLFDVPTEFNTGCAPWGSTDKQCYSPDNFDGTFKGPIKLRDALQQSINIPAVKLLYLVGIDETIKTAKDLGIDLAGNKDQYGLSLVLGGGEVSLLDMVHGYSTLANYGKFLPDTGILRVVDGKGNVLEEYTEKEGTQVITEDATKTLASVLTDNTARIPTFGANSALYIPGYQIAAKTGTTNNNKDAWLIGYTPNITVGVWAGNNDNKQMKKGGAAIAGPSWNEFMRYALSKYPAEVFMEAPAINTNIKPSLRGSWMGDESKIIDSRTGMLADDTTPIEFKKEVISGGVHSILYYVDKNNPLGDKPSNPYNNPMFKNWEYGVQNWWSKNSGRYGSSMSLNLNTESNINKPQIIITTNPYEILKNNLLSFDFSITSKNQIRKTNVFFNGKFIGETTTSNFSKQLTTEDVLEQNSVTLITEDVMSNSTSKTITF
ncbi:MAG: transglycosylase domain-containing protein [Candidatus Pacebacteria bacterium]|nr:transglycosylase domain-containing protein [Candidatus Paceibacterota bacterium]